MLIRRLQETWASLNDEAGLLWLGITNIANEKIETRGQSGDFAEYFQDKAL